MTSEPFSILWFRQDLRITDNPALLAAIKSGSVLPVFILDDINAGEWARGAASRSWLHHSLHALDQSLDGNLQFFVGDARKILARLVEQNPVKAIFWNRCYEPWRIQRDSLIKSDLSASGVECHSYNAALLWEPWTVNKKDGGPYRVFTPFYQKGCMAAPPPRPPLPGPDNPQWYTKPLDASQSLDSLTLLPRENWHQSLTAHWEIGEQAAHHRLESFLQDCLGDYRQARDFPAMEATSKLSPHLHFGEISPQQLWSRIDPGHLQDRGEGASHFLREIAWREFSYHLLYHFPQLPDKNFNSRFDKFEWLDDESDYDAWRQARTGFPIIDAGLRELWQTGYMHNRVRMIVASFLIKNMLVHWRQGERWFWDCLVDADLASNSAGWQWCAGSGADAAPYFRIFNPLLQSQKFDPKGEYLARYCPELAGLPVKFRHQPWLADDSILQQAGIKLGEDYPKPVLDLKTTRERALARFKAMD